MKDALSTWVELYIQKASDVYNRERVVKIIGEIYQKWNDIRSNAIHPFNLRLDFITFSIDRFRDIKNGQDSSNVQE